MSLQTATPLLVLDHRFIGGDKIPEYWGRPSPYTEGTDFLGTPPNHHEVNILFSYQYSGCFNLLFDTLCFLLETDVTSTVAHSLP